MFANVFVGGIHMSANNKQHPNSISDWIKHTNSVTIPNFTDGPLQEYLNNNFINSRNIYLSSINMTSIPEPFIYPFSYFYTKPHSQSKSANIYTTIKFQTEQGNYISKLTLKTFPAFLKYYCGIHYPYNQYLSDFYQALVQLIQQYPRSKSDKELEKIKQFSPQFAHWLMTGPSNVYVDTNNNLYFDPQPFFGQYPTAFGQPKYQSILCLPLQIFPKTNYVKSYVKEYFDNFSKTKEKIDLYSISFPKDSLFYYSALNRNHIFFSANYQPESDSFSLQKYPNYNDTYSLKAIPLVRGNSLVQVPKSITHLFKHLCGENTNLLDQLARFFAMALAPSNSAGLTVLYTKQHKKLLSDCLIQVFLEMMAYGSLDSPFASFNQLSHGKNRKQLFIAQTEGKGIVFVEDIPPTTSNVSILIKMIKGKAINISTDFFPDQHYANNLHFICVTDDASKLESFGSSLNQIDFTRYESPLETPIKFTNEDIHWLRSTFTLYGLKLRTLSLSKITDPNPYKIEPVLPSSDAEDVQLFIDKGCLLTKDSFSQGCDLHIGYKNFYRALYGKEKSPIGRNKFLE